MSLLFSPLKIGPLTIKNRIMRSACYESLGNPDGTPKPRLLRMMENLSKGEVGLIIPGYMYTTESGKALPRQCGLTNIQQGEKWKSTIEKVHKNGSKIVFQICHCGIASLPQIEKVAPTTFPGQFRGLTTTEVEDIIDSFHRSAIVAQKSGADGVEIHAAHGYLYSLFLSPYYNRRTDEYGGSVEGRCRIVYETAKSIRKSCPNLLVMIKMNGCDYIPDGVTPEIASRYVNHLKNVIDMFEISCAIRTPGASSRVDSLRDFKFNYGFKFEEAFNLPFADFIKKKNKDALIASVGGFRSANVMEDALVNKKIDMISLARPLIRDPHFVLKIKKNRNAKSECISCNHCLMTVDSDPRGLMCDYPTK